MFDPEFNARAISARRRVTGNPWFKRGTLVLATKGIPDATAKQVEMLQQAVRSSLENHAGKTVERVVAETKASIAKQVGASHDVCTLFSGINGCNRV
jgi:hypothetical protein